MHYVAPENDTYSKSMPLNRPYNLFMTINFTFTFLYILWAITPYLNRNLPHLFLALILVGWIFSAVIIALTNKNLLKKRIPSILILISVWIIWGLILRVLGYSTSLWGNYYMEMLYWFPLYVFFFYTGFMKTSYYKKIVLSVMLIFSFNIFDNIRLMQLYPDAKNFITSSFELGTFYRSMNVGDTIFGFMALLMIPLLLSYRKATGNKLFKISFLMLIISIFFYLYQASKTTALLLAVVSLVVFICSKVLNSSKIDKGLKILGVTLIFVLFFSSLIYMPSLLMWAASNTGDEKISSRLSAIAVFLNGGNYESQSLSFALRIDFWMMSLKTFFQNFFIGVGAHSVAHFEYGIGGHSQVFDTLARYGLVGIIFLSLIYKRYLDIIKNTVTIPKMVTGVLTLGIIFVAYAFVNLTVHPSIGVVLFLLIPFSSIVFNKKMEL